MSGRRSPGLFVTGTGTGVGKTFFARGLVRSLASAGVRVAALKPYETGCDPQALDAIALGRACGRPELAESPGLYRAHAPLAPWAATLGGEPPPPALAQVATTVRAFEADNDFLCVEGAGGLLVPIDRDHTIADLARALGYPLVFVGRDALGVLSETLCGVEAARARGLEVLAIVLQRHDRQGDASRATNAAILRERLDLPVFVLEAVAHDAAAGATDVEDEALAAGVRRSGVEACVRARFARLRGAAA